MPRKEKVSHSLLAQKMKACWKSGIVPQKQVAEFTGGLLQPQTLVNLCSRGEGPRGKIYIRGRACWPVDDFLNWLLENVSGDFQGFEIHTQAPHRKRRKKAPEPCVSV